MNADEPHELFLPEAPGDTVIRPVWLTVTRERPFRESHGRPLSPDELPDLDAIRDRWGSGVYFVQARDAKKHVLAARRYTIRGGGKPRAMDDGAGDAESSDYEDVRPGAAPSQAPNAREDHFTMLLAMMREDKESRREEMRSFTAGERERNQQFQTMLMKFFEATNQTKAAAIVQTEGSSKDAKEAFTEGMEFMSTLVKELRDQQKSGGGEDGDDGDEIGKTFRTVATVWAMKNLGPEGAAQVGAMLGGDSPFGGAPSGDDGGGAG